MLSRDGEAEPLLRRALDIARKTKGANSPEVAAALNNIATLYSDQERYDDAKPLLKRSLAIREKILGQNHPDTALALNNLAVLYQQQKHYDDAEPLLKRSLAIMEKTKGQDRPRTAVALNNLAMLYQDQGRNEKAEKLFKRSLAIRETALGAEHPDVGVSLLNLAGLYQAMNRTAEAQSFYDRSLAIFKKTLGENHTLLSRNLNNQADLKYQQQKWAEAAKLWEESVDLLIQRKLRGMAGAGAVETEKARFELNKENVRFRRLMKVSYRAAASPVQMSETAAKMFKIAQWARNSQTAHSIALMAARQVKGDGPLAKLIRERQDLVSEWQALDKNLLAAASREENKRSPKAEEEARERMTAIDARLKEIDASVEEDYPEYASLASPEPLSAEDVQGLLKSDEALVLFLDTPEKAPLPGETFVWVVTPTKMLWVSVDIGTAELQREVSSLRCGLDAEAWGKGSKCAKTLDVKYSYSDYRKGRPLPFDASRAHALYKVLFSKIEDQIKGKKLLVVASGALTQLPFQVLVTKKPQTAFPDAEGMRKVRWLIRDNTLTVLPAVSSLKALRRFAKASTGEKTYLGIGNPLLDGRDQRDASRAKQAREKRNCSGLKAKQPTSNEFRLSRSIAPLELTGGMANVNLLRMQSPLPETADELCTVAHDLKASDDDVLLGSKATEANIKTLSTQGTLAQYRVLHFATHGALAGQITADAEPGLILTPPAKATPVDDGYLSTSEILGLKLNAGWVILSACNTAGAKAHSAEVLSGMARAFFYAGARSIVVSHWSVRSEPTVKLVTSALEAITSDSAATPAEALRSAMLKLIDKGSLEEAHPESWAPFVLVGEGGSA
jgi:CHAT domain-containing protein/tetratricopeptide (TPR) repeat protein